MLCMVGTAVAHAKSEEDVWMIGDALTLHTTVFFKENDSEESSKWAKYHVTSEQGS